MLNHSSHFDGHIQNSRVSCTREGRVVSTREGKLDLHAVERSGSLLMVACLPSTRKIINGRRFRETLRLPFGKTIPEYTGEHSQSATRNGLHLHSNAGHELHSHAR